MARTNLKTKATEFTHEGAPAWQHTKPVEALRRSVLSCLLWEDQFYESGEDIGTRIAKLAGEVELHTLAALAIEARSKFNLRHVPLLLLSVLADRGRGNAIVPETIRHTIQRADELAELLTVYAKYKKAPVNSLKKIMPHGMRHGIALAFQKFSAYSLAKYNRDGAVKLRDALFLSHAKPKDAEQAETFKQLTENNLPVPDTWETELSAGKDKKETFERLIREEKLGYLALLRNLRNMTQASVDEELVRSAIRQRKGSERVLPFRFVAAARYAPQYEPELDLALQANILNLPVLSGKTAVLVDVSGSMNDRLSGRSDMTRMDAAAALASIINGDARIFTFSHLLVEVPPRRGMAGVDAIKNSQPHGGTYLGQAIAGLSAIPRDRLIVITDEQSHDLILVPDGRKYLINVASYRNGVGYGDGWTHIDGFSENVIRYMYETETADDASTT